MKIFELELKTIKPYEKNAKVHDETQINNVAESIKQYGFKQPIVVDKNNVIIIGHCRFLASKKLGLEKVPCIIADDLNEEQVKKLRLLDNKTNESDWDFDLLKLDLEGLDFDGFDIDWELPEEKTDATDDDFDVDAFVPDVPESKKGDIYLLGEHRLMCGDSTNQDDVKSLIGEDKVKLLLTDPPYNVAYDANGTREGIENDDFGNSESYIEFLTSAFKNADEHLENGAVFYIFLAGRMLYENLQAVKNAEWVAPHLLIWEKDSLVLGRSDYQYIHEPFLYGWKEGAAHLWNNDRKQVSVIKYPRPKASKLHPTMKPIELFSYLMNNSSKGRSPVYEGDVVLDLFSGSGTTLICAEQLGRKARCMEFDEKFADVIVKRYLHLTNNIKDCYLVRGGVNNTLKGYTCLC